MLAQNSEFEPYSTFVRLDRNGDNLICAGDIKTFLNDNHRMGYSINDCALLIKYFDIDGDCALNYTEFL
jgi:Ca2+-binding EF-hand superfamily protein